MELKAGYKKTKVGIIPVDWRVVTVDEISAVGRGRVISHKEIARSRDACYPVYSSQTADEGVMGYLDCYDFDGEYVTWTTDGENAGTVFARNGKFSCTNVCGTIKLRADNYLFVAAALNRVTGRHVSRHVGNPKLMNGVMKKVAFALPERREEQDSIATALGDVDALLAAQDALIAKKRAIKQGAMQELLIGKRRLPGFSGEWEECVLGDVVRIRNEKISTRSVDAEMLCIELENVGQGSGRLESRSTAGSAVSTKYTFKTGDVLFGRLRSYLRKYWLATESGLCTTEIWPLVVNDERLLPGYLFAVVQTDAFIEAASIAFGTHMPRADWGVIRNFDVQLPSVKEQEAIVEMLNDMDAHIAALEAQRAKTAQLKQGMMQALLTGRIRLV